MQKISLMLSEVAQPQDARASRAWLISLGLARCSCGHETLICCWLQELGAGQSWPVSHTRCDGFSLPWQHGYHHP